jgi:hypothetical protein
MAEKNRIGIDITSSYSGEGTDAAKRGLKDLEEETGKAGKAAKESSQHFLTLRNAIKVIAGSAAIYAVASMAKEMALLNARLETMGVVLETVGRNAGYSRFEMEAHAEEVRSMGITMIESREAVVKLTQAQIDLSGASKLARIAQDAAVIANINSSEAMGRLVHGITSAQTEVLRAMDINVNFETSYRRLAKELNVNVDQLTEQEKVQARFNAVAAAGVKIQGAYEAAMGTAGKQIGSLARYHEDLKDILGETFNDALTTSVDAYTTALKAATDRSKELGKDGSLKQWGEDLTDTMAGFADQVMVVVRGLRVLAAAKDLVTAKLERGFATQREGETWKQAQARARDEYLTAEDKYGKAIDDLARQNPNAARDFVVRSRAARELAASERARVAEEEAREIAMYDAMYGKGAYKRMRQPKQERPGKEKGARRGARPLTFDELMAKGAMKRQEMFDQAELDATKNYVRDSAARAKEQEKEADAVKKLTRSYKDMIDPIEPLRRQLGELDKLYAAGKLTADEYGEATFMIQNRIEDLNGTAKEVAKDGLPELKSAIEGWGRGVSRELGQAAVSGELSLDRLGNAFRNLAAEIVAIQIQRQFMDPIIKGATGWLDGLFSGAGGDAAVVENHTGGIAGIDGRRRYVHPAYFDRAPRMHRGGIAGNEVPTILERGEEVLTRRDPRHRMNGGGMPQNLRVEIVNPPGVRNEVADVQPRLDVDGMVVRIILRDQREGGPITRGFGNTFGMSRSAG